MERGTNEVGERGRALQVLVRSLELILKGLGSY